MNYIGSKTRLLPFIQNTINEVCGNDLRELVFCDLFAGTGAVGKYFKSLCKSIISNDLEYYSYVLNKNYIGNTVKIPLDERISEMAKINSLEPKKGFIYNNYCIGGSGFRQYFSDENGMIIDATRQYLIGKENNERFFWLLCSLLESADSVANTTSIYGSYLKSLKKSAQKKLIIKSADFQEVKEQENLVLHEDANKAILNIEGDILYLDPPYNHRQYGANYHILNTIAKYDNFIPKGITGIREYERSKYCMKNKVEDEFENLIKNAHFNYIFLSYNNESIMSNEIIKNIMSKYGKYDLRQQDYQRYKADSNRKNLADSTIEYIHILEKHF